MRAERNAGKRPSPILVGEVGGDALRRTPEAGRYTRAIVCSLALHVAGFALLFHYVSVQFGRPVPDLFVFADEAPAPPMPRPPARMGDVPDRSARMSVRPDPAGPPRSQPAPPRPQPQLPARADRPTVAAPVSPTPRVATQPAPLAQSLERRDAGPLLGAQPAGPRAVQAPTPPVVAPDLPLASSPVAEPPTFVPAPERVVSVPMPPSVAPPAPPAAPEVPVAPPSPVALPGVEALRLPDLAATSVPAPRVATPQRGLPAPPLAAAAPVPRAPGPTSGAIELPDLTATAVPGPSVVTPQRGVPAPPLAAAGPAPQAAAPTPESIQLPDLTTSAVPGPTVGPRRSGAPAPPLASIVPAPRATAPTSGTLQLPGLASAAVPAPSVAMPRPGVATSPRPSDTPAPTVAAPASGTLQLPEPEASAPLTASAPTGPASLSGPVPGVASAPPTPRAALPGGPMLQLPQLATPSPQGSSGAVSPVAPSFGLPGGSTGVGTRVQTPAPTWTGEAGGLLRSTILQPATPLERAPATGPGVGPGPDTPGAVARAPELIGPAAPSQPTGSPGTLVGASGLPGAGFLGGSAGRGTVPPSIQTPAPPVLAPPAQASRAGVGPGGEGSGDSGTGSRSGAPAPGGSAVASRDPAGEGLPAGPMTGSQPGQAVGSDGTAPGELPARGEQRGSSVASVPPPEAPAGGRAGVGVTGSGTTAAVGPGAADRPAGPGEGGAGPGARRPGENGTGQGTRQMAQSGGGISITAPLNGHRVGLDEPPVIIVRGRVDDRSATAVVVSVNDLRITVPVVAGMFEAVVPGVESVVKLRAEVAGSTNRKRSQEVTVLVDAASVPTAVLLFDWGRAPSPPELDVRATWRGRSDRTDDPVLPVSVKSLPAYSSVFFIQNMKPGVYALSLGYRASEVPLSGTVYLGGGGAKATAKPLRNLKLNGAGRTILARLLMPFNVLWDEDSWFTGRSESSTTITKFRLPEGVSWVEDKGPR